MPRAPLVVREAHLADAPALAVIWAAELRGADAEQHLADVIAVLERVTGDHDERILLAEIDGEPVGGILLRLTPVSPLNLDEVVHAFAPSVLPAHRRRGVGRALMDAAVGFAEERGVGYVGSVALSTSREGNRFLARLALAPQATLRIAATPAVRAKLTAQLPRARRGHGTTRPLGQVLAARRSMRRPAP
ncbi:GNAT family N-acetyltransferase [Nocardioides sp.]|uniref:GNAT family N-acetyltransferase n=1 Tax=Nocardioides sp. TaxID=35761 RepID=UPI002736E2CD|nr:GNAT family N-acetyltransferase [Nocardioides sp.]MDP3894921.1 GNAT family N-acetyltransferase [Nocardioides sp.]